MTAFKQINDVTLRVNNKVIPYEAETLKFVLGKGEFLVRSVIVGGTERATVFSKDLTTRTGQVKFSIPSTAFSIAEVKDWKNNENNNVIEASGNGVDFTAISTEATMLNDPEINIASEGVIEIEFMGNPID